MCTKKFEYKNVMKLQIASSIETVSHFICTRDLSLYRFLGPLFRSVIHLKRPIVVFHTSRWGFCHFAEFWYFLSGALVDIIFLSRDFTHTYIHIYIYTHYTHIHKHTKDTPWISQFEWKLVKKRRKKIRNHRYFDRIDLKSMFPSRIVQRNTFHSCS